jgi:predicted nucleic acid-binding protein
MTRFLLDTTFIVDVLNDRRGRSALMRNLIEQQHELACCAVNVTEVHAGMREPEAAKTEALLRSLEFVPIGFDAARMAGDLRRKRQSNGIYAQASFGAEVESWWHREGSIASTGAERKRIS